MRIQMKIKWSMLTRNMTMTQIFKQAIHTTLLERKQASAYQIAQIFNKQKKNGSEHSKRKQFEDKLNKLREEDLMSPAQYKGCGALEIALREYIRYSKFQDEFDQLGGDQTY